MTNAGVIRVGDVLVSPSSTDAARFDALRGGEFARLDEGSHVYLDYTGAGLYAQVALWARRFWPASPQIGTPDADRRRQTLAPL